MGDGEVEPNAEQILQLALEVCKEDVITLIVHKMAILGWEVSYGDFYFFYTCHAFNLLDCTK